MMKEDMIESDYWHIEAENPAAHFLFAHGAGAGYSSHFIQAMAKNLASRQISVSCFHFDYMVEAIRVNKRRPPQRLPHLIAQYCHHLEALHDDNLPIFIGGKSMGGRVATHVAADSNMSHLINGVLVFGYPFHPINKVKTARTEHLGDDYTMPTYIVQGTNDKLGNAEEVATYTLSPSIEVCWIEAANHDLISPKRLVSDPEKQWQHIADGCIQFIHRVMENSTR